MANWPGGCCTLSVPATFFGSPLSIVDSASVNRHATGIFASSRYLLCDFLSIKAS
jgi:hypothetical protein